MRGKGIFLVLLAMSLFMVFLIGCQQQAEKAKDVPDSMEIVDETQKPIAGEIEKEFNDSLDTALEELEEIEDI